MKYLLPLFVFSFMLTACKSTTNEQNEQSHTTTQDEAKPATTTTKKAATTEVIPTDKPATHFQVKNNFAAKTSTGKTFIIDRKEAEGVTKYTLNGEGFKFAKATNLPNHADVKEVLTADLDGNGFDEAYIIYNCEEDGETKPVISAYVSFKDRSFGPIYVKSASAKMLKGYHGEDKIYIENGQLFREFPIYDDDKKTDKTQKIKYKLIAGEAGYTLEGVMNN